MEITSREVGSVTVVTVHGRMTADESNGRVKETIGDLIAKGRKQVVVNLEGISYMDSGGLGEMVACYASANRAGGAVRLANTTKRIKDLLIITKLSTVFDMFESEADAVRSFGAAV